VARRWKVLTVTSVAVFMAILDVTIVNIAFPDIRRSFPHDSLSDLSRILNGYNIVFAAALVPAGRLADRVGRKKLFIIGVLVFAPRRCCAGCRFLWGCWSRHVCGRRSAGRSSPRPR